MTKKTEIKTQYIVCKKFFKKNAKKHLTNYDKCSLIIEHRTT